MPPFVFFKNCFCFVFVWGVSFFFWFGFGSLSLSWLVEVLLPLLLPVYLFSNLNLM